MMIHDPTLERPSTTLKRLVVLLCALLLGSACTAPANRTAAVPEAGSDASTVGHDLASAQTGTVAVEEDDPIVCRQIVRTGTRVAQKVCMRRSEMQKAERDAAEMLGEVQRRSAMQKETKP